VSRLGSGGSRLVPAAGFCEHTNESLHSINGREFLDHLNDYQLFKDSASWD
jgi:hypothetical protein